jgi:hypothetical protein
MNNLGSFLHYEYVLYQATFGLDRSIFISQHEGAILGILLDYEKIQANNPIQTIEVFEIP